MKVLVDTNVVLDSLLGQDPFFDDSDKVIKLCGNKAVDGYLAFDDLEDALQNQCAAEIQAEYIITRNKKDFMRSDIPCISPSEFILFFEDDTSGDDVEP